MIGSFGLILYADINFINSVKTPAVKPCIVYIIDLPDSVGSKVPGAERFVGSPH